MALMTHSFDTAPLRSLVCNIGRLLPLYHDCPERGFAPFNYNSGRKSVIISNVCRKRGLRSYHAHCFAVTCKPLNRITDCLYYPRGAPAPLGSLRSPLRAALSSNVVYSDSWCWWLGCKSSLAGIFIKFFLEVKNEERK